MFIMTEDEVFVAVSEIASAEWRSDGSEGSWFLALKNGDTIRATDHEWERAQRDLMPVIPAQPGYFVIRIPYNDNDEAWEIASEPIVAWRIDGDAMPVTLEGKKLPREYAIECPNGRVIVPHGETYKSIDKFRALMWERRKKRTPVEA